VENELRNKPIAAANPATPAPTMITFNGHAAWKVQFVLVLSWKCGILAFAKRIAQVRNISALGLMRLKDEAL
jgi:hypothetical protein